MTNTTTFRPYQLINEALKRAKEFNPQINSKCVKALPYEFEEENSPSLHALKIGVYQWCGGERYDILGHSSLGYLDEFRITRSELIAKLISLNWIQLSSGYQERKTNKGEFANPCWENEHQWCSPEKHSVFAYLSEKMDRKLEFDFKLSSELEIHCECWITSFLFTFIYKGESIGEYGWGENGSGFNKKYTEIIRIISETCEGEDWKQYCNPIIEQNRTSSYSPKNGHSVKFWDAVIASPEGVELEEDLINPFSN